jgi:hypothetical protein
MTPSSCITSSARTPISPLMLSDRLLRLAEDADSAGFRTAAVKLLTMASQVLDKPKLLHS